MYNKILYEAYFRILSTMDREFLDSGMEDRGSAKGLEAAFLPSVNAGYEYAKNKIMIVGRETRTWKPTPSADYSSLDDYIKVLMALHSKFFQEQLDAENIRGAGFHDFTRTVAAKCGSEGLVYANLFCFAWKKGIPVKSPGFNRIKEISEKLLKAQIEILQPDIIIFANGSSSAKYRLEFFPIFGKNKVCFGGRTYEEVPKKQLWEFYLHGNIRCFRIQHPSAWGQEAQHARRYLLNLLPAA